MLSILGRTQKLPKDLINVDFANSWIHESVAKRHLKNIFPMVTTDVQIMKPGFSFKNIFDRYSLGV